MTNKFLKYYDCEEKISEMSEYVQLNFRLIMTKMTSEMRRKLEIDPSLSNEAYMSLMYSLQGRLFNEMVYSMSGICQSAGMKLQEVIPMSTLLILISLMKGENPLNGKLREDMVDQEKFQKYYLEQIDILRKEIDALPK